MYVNSLRSTPGNFASNKNDMGTIYHFNQLTRLEFQLDASDVFMSCELTQKGVKTQTHFIISHSELNKILGNIQHFNPENDLFAELEITQLSEDLCIYSLDMQNSVWNNDWLSAYIFHEKYTEIRA